MTSAACNSSQEPSENTAEGTKTTQAQTQEIVTTTAKTEDTPSLPDVSDFETEAVDGGIKITKYTGDSKSVAIPEEIDGKKVVIIGFGAFSNRSDISEITIPNTVTRIETAFLNCTKLSEITIPDSVTEIYEGAFQDCSSIKEINIPQNVKNIGFGAFLGCEKLKSIEVDPLNIYFYSTDGVLFSRAYNGLHTFPMGKSDTAYVVPEGTERIAISAFYECSGISEITLPQSVTDIGSSAFYGCAGLVKINIPQSVTIIETSTFSNCSSLASINLKGVKSIGYAAFWDCVNLVDVNISDDVWNIDETFAVGCEKIKAVYKGKTYTYEEIDALIEDLS